jgi:hypothetical protein
LEYFRETVNENIEVRIMATQLWNFRLFELHSVWFAKHMKDFVPLANIAT